MTFKSCGKKIKSKEFKIALTALSKSNNDNWLPVYVDNADWKNIEFVCTIEMKQIVYFNTKKIDGFQYVNKYSILNKFKTIYKMKYILDNDWRCNS